MAGELNAGDGADFPEAGPEERTGACHECGGEFFTDPLTETTHHVGDGSDGIDYDLDLDHVPFALDAEWWPWAAVEPSASAAE